MCPPKKKKISTAPLPSSPIDLSDFEDSDYYSSDDISSLSDDGDDGPWEAPKPEHFSMAMRLSNNSYDHPPSMPGALPGNIADSFGKDLPVGFKTHVYASFVRPPPDAPKPPRGSQQKAIKDHFAGKSSSATHVPSLHVATLKAAKPSALAVAKLYGASDDSSFEWCHAQADSLGGVNDRQNLFSASSNANTYMMVLEGVVRSHSEISATVSIAYEQRAVDLTTNSVAQRTSAHICPMYVLYTLEEATKKRTAKFLIYARTKGFNKEDQRAVLTQLKAAFPGLIKTRLKRPKPDS